MYPATRARIQTLMAIEQVSPNKPSFGTVVALFAVAILVIFITAAIIVTWRAHSKEKTPYTKHPVSQLSVPELRQLAW